MGATCYVLYRTVLSNPLQLQPLNIVAINDIAEPATLLHLLKYDSTHGRLSTVSDIHIELKTVDLGKTTAFLLLSQGEFRQNCIDTAAHCQQITLAKTGIDMVLESTGHFAAMNRRRSILWRAPNEVMIGAAPFDHVDASIVVGVNDHELSRDKKIFIQRVVPPKRSYLYYMYCIMPMVSNQQ